MGGSFSALREIARLDPNRAEAHHDLGVTCLRCGHAADAAVALQRAVELRPGFPSALAALAEALDQLGREREASAAFHREPCRRRPGRPRIYLAKALMLDDRLEEAERELQRARVLAPARAAPNYLLGQLQSQRGRFEAAREHLARAIELAPEEPYAFSDLVIARRMDDSDRPLLTRMQALTERAGLDETLRINVHFGLGKAFDDLGDRATAMRHYDTANRLKAMSVRLDRPPLVQHFDSLISGFTAEALDKTARAVARPRHQDDGLPLLILGMPRSGTTLVEQVLSSHPAVAAGGELSFWKERLDVWTISKQRNIDAAVIAQVYRRGIPRPAPSHRPTRVARHRQGAGQFPTHLADPARFSRCAHRPLPAQPGRYVPVDLLYALQGSARLRL